MYRCLYQVYENIARFSYFYNVLKTCGNIGFIFPLFFLQKYHEFHNINDICLTGLSDVFPPFLGQGITTYEYVVAMRAMSEAPPASVDDDNQNVLYSPTGSATTGLSGASSLGLQYKGAWCTPPRVFVDYQVQL